MDSQDISLNSPAFASPIFAKTARKKPSKQKVNFSEKKKLKEEKRKEKAEKKLKAKEEKERRRREKKEEKERKERERKEKEEKERNEKKQKGADKKEEKPAVGLLKKSRSKSKEVLKKDDDDNIPEELHLIPTSKSESAETAVKAAAWAGVDVAAISKDEPVAFSSPIFPPGYHY